MPSSPPTSTATGSKRYSLNASSHAFESCRSGDSKDAVPSNSATLALPGRRVSRRRSAPCCRRCLRAASSAWAASFRLRTARVPVRCYAVSACCRSRQRSSGCSQPTLSRSRPAGKVGLARDGGAVFHRRLDTAEAGGMADDAHAGAYGVDGVRGRGAALHVEDGLVAVVAQDHLGADRQQVEHRRRCPHARGKRPLRRPQGRRAAPRTPPRSGSRRPGCKHGRSRAGSPKPAPAGHSAARPRPVVPPPQPRSPRSLPNVAPWRPV